MIFVKRSVKLLTIVMVTTLVCSVGLGATMDVNSDIDGTVNPADYDIVINDVDAGGEVFANTGSDIDALYWGVAPGATYPGNQADLWYAVGMTVEAPPINTLGDGTSLIPSPTTVNLGISQGGSNLYTINVLMFGGNVLNVLMLDLAAPGSPMITLDPTTLKHSIDSGLEIAIHASKFTNLSPDSPFDFDLHFEGGGENDDDRIQGRIPEPATMSILLIGGLAVARRRRRR